MYIFYILKKSYLRPKHPSTHPPSSRHYAQDRDHRCPIVGTSRPYAPSGGRLATPSTCAGVWHRRRVGGHGCVAVEVSRGRAPRHRICQSDPSRGHRFRLTGYPVLPRHKGGSGWASCPCCPLRAAAHARPRRLCEFFVTWSVVSSS